MYIEFKLASSNAFNSIKCAHPIWGNLRSGKASYDAKTRILKIWNPDDFTVKMISDANSAWAAVDGDPASAAQIKYLSDLAQRPETRILNIERFDLSILTLEQASRMISCCKDVIEHGY